ncbi:ubiquinol-cytochrome c reductase iron-sulfur subunit [Acidobacteriota bacterium]
MKVKHSLFTRRNFLNGLIGGWAAALGATFLAPLVSFIFPPTREPDEVRLPLPDYSDMTPNSTKFFPWGAKPGILKKNDDGTYTAFVAVCTHLDCNVAYMSDQRKFFCACHDGWYDEKGVNIAGPPPSPLRTLFIQFEEQEIVLRKQEKTE